jgi:hypothetical protein
MQLRLQQQGLTKQMVTARLPLLLRPCYLVMLLLLVGVQTRHRQGRPSIASP